MRNQNFKTQLFGFSLFCSLVLIQSTTWAAKSKTKPAAPVTNEDVLDLRQQAQAESIAPLQKPSSKKIPKTEESSEQSNLNQDPNPTMGALRLSDPYASLNNKKNKWSLGLKIEKNQPKGIISVANKKVDLGTSTGTLMPSVEFGLTSQDIYTDNFPISFSTFVTGGLTSGALDINGAVGSVETQIQTSRVSIAGQANVRWFKYQQFLAHLRFDVGQSNLTGTSSSSLYQFSFNNIFTSYALGFETEIPSSKSAIILNYFEQKALTDNDQWSSTQSNLQLGVRYKW